MGSKSNLLRMLAVNHVATAAGGAPIVVPKWRKEWDSNPRMVAHLQFSRLAP